MPFAEGRLRLFGGFGIINPRLLEDSAVVVLDLRLQRIVLEFQRHVEGFRNINLPPLQMLFEKKIQILQGVGADARAAVRGIGDCVSVLAADPGIGVVRAVVIESVVVQGAEHQHGTFDEGRIGLRFDPRDIAVPFVAHIDFRVVGKFTDVAIGAPARRIDGHAAFYVGGKHGLPGDFPARPYSHHADPRNVPPLLEIFDGIQRHGNPLEPAGFIRRGIHAVVPARTHEIGIFQGFGIHGAGGVFGGAFPLAAVIGHEHGVAFVDKIIQPLVVQRLARLGKQQHGGKPLSCRGLSEARENADAAVVCLAPVISDVPEPHARGRVLRAPPFAGTKRIAHIKFFPYRYGA